MLNRRRFLLAALGASTSLSLTGQAHAQASMRDIQKRLRARFGGRMVDARRANRNTYVIDWLSGDGRKLTIIVDAESGAVRSVRGG